MNERMPGLLKASIQRDGVEAVPTHRARSQPRTRTIEAVLSSGRLNKEKTEPPREV